jgi:hypothetical protein
MVLRGAVSAPKVPSKLTGRITELVVMSLSPVCGLKYQSHIIKENTHFRRQDKSESTVREL